MGKTRAAQPRPQAGLHIFRVGDDATCVCRLSAYYGKIAEVSPTRVCFLVDGLCVWFQRRGDRWIGDDDTVLVPR